MNEIDRFKHLDGVNRDAMQHICLAEIKKNVTTARRRRIPTPITCEKCT